MNPYQFAALASFPLALALACSDDDSNSETGQGGTQNASNGGSQDGSNAGAAGSSSMSGGSGGSSGSGGNGGTGGSSSGATGAEDVCGRGCIKSEPLNCPMDPANCEAACVAEFLDFPAACRDLVLAFGECAADRPTSDYLCGEDGESTLRDGVCESESLAAVTCVLGEL